MKTRIALGGFPEFLTPFESTNGSVELLATFSMSHLCLMNRKELRIAMESFSQFDHVVFRLSGENPMDFLETLWLHGLFSYFVGREYSVSFWTMDSHHLGKHEARAARYFDHVFVAHKNYLGLFPKESSSYLPCSFSLAPEGVVAEYLKSDTRGLNSSDPGGVCAPFAVYPWQKRNLGYLEGLWAANDSEKKSFFGTVHGGSLPNEGLITTILSHRVVLNISLKDDLNMRNFEALVLNKILLTNRVSDHSLLQEFTSNIVFLEPDLSDLMEKLDLAISLEPSAISSLVLAKHSIRVRVEEMVELLLSKSTNEMATCDLASSRLRETSAEYARAVKVSMPHSPELMIARGGWISTRHLRRVLDESSTPINSGIKVFSNWLHSLILFGLSTLAMNIPFLKAIFRAAGLRI